MKISKEMEALLCCPACHSRLDRTAQDGLFCSTCQLSYPVVNDIPVLINEASSIFRRESFVNQAITFYRPAPPRSKLRRVLSAFVPDYGTNIKATANFGKLASLLRERQEKQRVLVVGGSVFNVGMEPLLNDGIELVEADVSFGDRTQMILDAHDIPFQDGSFDAVVAQAVLEHVLDPKRCVAEFHRVLKSDGLVYAETPFLQCVHAGPYDFTRFTHMGHRYLFRAFEELSSGAVVGPSVAFASAYFNFLVSFGSTERTRIWLGRLAALTIFWPKWFERFSVNKPRALDFAYGYYFLGKRSEFEISGQELMGLYRGTCTLLSPRRQ